MDKEKDKLYSDAYSSGREDAEQFGFDVPCPFEPESYEAKCWLLGFNDWAAEQYNN